MIVENRKRNQPLPVGSHIRTRRKELGMTLQGLAEASGLSAPFISQVECNQSVPSIVSLVKLARALDVDMNYFVEVPQNSSVVHRANRQPRIAVDSPVEYFQLGASLPDQKLDAILMRIPPGHDFPVDQREGEDFLYILEGELKVGVGDMSTTLRKGDNVHFDGRLPHTARNESGRVAVVLYVGTPSIFRAKEQTGDKRRK